MSQAVTEHNCVHKPAGKQNLNSAEISTIIGAPSAETDQQNCQLTNCFLRCTQAVFQTVLPQQKIREEGICLPMNTLGKMQMHLKCI